MIGSLSLRRGAELRFSVDLLGDLLHDGIVVTTAAVGLSSSSKSENKRKYYTTRLMLCSLICVALADINNNEREISN